MFELPTIEECQAFHAKINEGRALIGEEPLDTLEFDEALPGDSSGCLSAMNLFQDAGYLVRASAAVPWSEPNWAVLDILGGWSTRHKGYLLPQEIKTLTDRFDALAEVHEPDEGTSAYDDARAALRARLVEAGAVAP
jgi:hypothetical protein